ncbi:MAG TPA: hypothetical protein VMB71_07180 [Acetobacteraceae bacterium]|nr:hypothetical protein [Acetobacteraceae bacterium]
MFTTPQNGRAYTDFFTSIAAGDVRVAGLPAGSAGSSLDGNAAITSRPGYFTVGPDTAYLLNSARRKVPSRPGTHAETAVLLHAAE